MTGKILPAPLTWRKVDTEPGEFGSGIWHEYRATTPFSMDYVVTFYDADFEVDAFNAADESGYLSELNRRRIRKRWGEPSDTNPLWQLQMESIDADGNAALMLIYDDMNRFDAQTAAYMDYTFRVNQSVGIETAPPDFLLLFPRPMKDKK